MLAYTIKRLLISIPLVLGIVTITFVMIRVAPGDPLDMYLEPQRQRQVDPEIIELLRKKYGLDQPLHIQYIRWISAVRLSSSPGAARGSVAASAKLSSRPGPRS